MTTHMKTGTKIYRTWQNMKNRCYNENVQCHKNYGGRGICVCREWKNSFINFYNDMGDVPDGHSLERIDNDKGYSPENCKWATKKVQTNNARSNIRLVYNGENLTLSQWSRRTGLNYDTLRYRILYYKWPVEKALTFDTQELTHQCHICGYKWKSKKDNPCGCAKCKCRRHISRIVVHT